MVNARADIERLATLAGLTVNGSAAIDPQIHDDRAYRSLLSGDSLAIGEAFVDGLWDVADLAGMYTAVLEAKVHEQIGLFDNFGVLVRAGLLNLQSRARAFQVGQQHYDLGNDLYQAMLDARMVYTCAMWDGATTLEEAQENKLEAMCRKLDLQPGDRVLDIGCGWGSFMKYAVERYDVTCVGLSVSEAQTTLGRERCAGLPIEFIITDYRDYEDDVGFDHIVSIEMIEAVGRKNFRTYFERVATLLRPGGRFGLQTIGASVKHPVADPWIDRYIFPNGVLPSLYELEVAVRGLFVFEHLENIGPEYDPTLMEWWRRFDVAYPELQARNPKYDERLYRRWKFYLQSCAGLFRAGQCQDWQIIFSLRP